MERPFVQRHAARPEDRSSPGKVRLEFEQLLAHLLATFINLPPDEFDAHIHRVLGRLGDFMDVDRITLWELMEDLACFRVTHTWAADGVEPFRLRSSNRFPRITKHVL